MNKIFLVALAFVVFANLNPVVADSIDDQISASWTGSAKDLSVSSRNGKADANEAATPAVDNSSPKSQDEGNRINRLKRQLKKAEDIGRRLDDMQPPPAPKPARKRKAKVLVTPLKGNEPSEGPREIITVSQTVRKPAPKKAKLPRIIEMPKGTFEVEGNALVWVGRLSENPEIGQIELRSCLEQKCFEVETGAHWMVVSGQPVGSGQVRLTMHQVVH